MIDCIIVNLSIDCVNIFFVVDRWGIHLLQRKCKLNAEYQACLNILLRCSFSSAKKMQTSAKKACFQFAECSFSSAKI
ncbi:MAG TPA: hypothetical protein DEQ66_07920 [Prevotella sp.]|nr:hypothetical protein [Prevotella sp.]